MDAHSSLAVVTLTVTFITLIVVGMTTFNKYFSSVKIWWRRPKRFLLFNKDIMHLIAPLWLWTWFGYIAFIQAATAISISAQGAEPPMPFVVYLVALPLMSIFLAGNIVFLQREREKCRTRQEELERERLLSSSFHYSWVLPAARRSSSSTTTPSQR